MKKIKSKSTAYPLLQVFIVIVIFLLINFWSVGRFENYKKMSEFKNGLLSKNFKFKQFPPNEFLGVKLYDDFEKYLLVNKNEIRVNEVNNTKYYEIKKKQIKFTNPHPEFLDNNIAFIANENGKIEGIFAVHEIKLKNNNNFLNFCTKARNSFLRQHNLSKLNFKNEYFYTEDGEEFFDSINFDLLIKNNNARFSIICGSNINISSINYLIVFFLHDVNLWNDMVREEDLKITSKKLNSNNIRKYRDKRKKK
jgi:hypothetical protein